VISLPDDDCPVHINLTNAKKDKGKVPVKVEEGSNADFELCGRVPHIANHAVKVEQVEALKEESSSDELVSACRTTSSMKWHACHQSISSSSGSPSSHSPSVFITPPPIPTGLPYSYWSPVGIQESTRSPVEIQQSSRNPTGLLLDFGNCQKTT
jgi:hypothetical protein